MGAPILSLLLLATLLSDYVVICGWRTQQGHPEDAAEASSNHERTFWNFDSSPALTHLEFDGGSPSSNLHRDGDAVFPGPRPHDPGSPLGDYDYATYDQSNYPQWHEDHLISSEHGENAAQPFWASLGQQQPMATTQPPSAHLTGDDRKTTERSEFDPTHSFFGSMFFGTKGPSDAGGRGTTSPPPPPPATQKPSGSSVVEGSQVSTTAPVGQHTTASTSTVPGVHGDRDRKALQNGAPFATTEIESLVLESAASTATSSRGSPTFGKLAEASSTPRALTELAGPALLQMTSTDIGTTARNSPEQPTHPEATRETGPSRGTASTPDVPRDTTVVPRGPTELPTAADLSGNEASQHTTPGVTSTVSGALGNDASTAHAPEPADIVPRQAVGATVTAPPQQPGGIAHLPTPPAVGGTKEVMTTTGRPFTNATTGSHLTQVHTTANQTETAATRPVKSTPLETTSSRTSPSTLPETTEQPSTKPATSLLETRTTVQRVAFREESPGFATTQTTPNSSVVSEASGMSGLPENTTQTPAAMSTTHDGLLQNHTAALTRAAVAESNETSTTSQVSVESSTVRPTLPSAAPGLRRLNTSPTTSQPTRDTPAVVQGTQETPAMNVALQQTPPPSRPVSPATPVRPPVTADAYVGPITQHGVHEFVPQRHKDVEDYYNHRHHAGHMEDDDHLRRGECGRCQRRLHYCVQKCFLHHSCEAEANPGKWLSCSSR
ncbi:hypothetical protein HPB50_026181 [Hyalomma asiaticum]|uniref:Uncharacterized protein n=1 Tax=Hyalomma asiaticum TaxID=266040 RepID=A0ACB7RLK0_HYAAI|nr:hypothetical protein HPB50_026181 [Hyalomma asiaticum]